MIEIVCRMCCRAQAADTFEDGFEICRAVGWRINTVLEESVADRCVVSGVAFALCPFCIGDTSRLREVFEGKDGASMGVDVECSYCGVEYRETAEHECDPKDLMDRIDELEESLEGHDESCVSREELAEALRERAQRLLADGKPDVDGARLMATAITLVADEVENGPL